MRVVRSVQGAFKSAGIETQVETARKNKDGTARKAVEVGFHSLRHSLISNMGNAGIPLALVKTMAGHLSEAMTEHYFHASDKALREAIAVLPDLTAPAALPARAGAVEDAVIVEEAGGVAGALAALREACAKLAAAKPTAANWREAAAILKDAKRGE